MRRAAAALMAAACALLAGCMGPMQADEYIYVVAMGFDRGETYKYNFSFLVQKEAGGEGQASSGGMELISAEGDSIFDAVTTVHSGGPYRLNFSRASGMVFAAELLGAGEMQQLTDVAFNALKVRQSVKLIASLCPAEEFLSGMSSSGASSAKKLLYGLFDNFEEEGTTEVTNYSQFMECIRDSRMDGVMMLGNTDSSAAQAGQRNGNDGGGSGADAGGGETQGGQGAEQGEKEREEERSTTAGVKRSGGMSSYVSGTALFEGWNMKGVLDDEDTKLMLMAKGEFQKGNMTIPYGDETARIYLISSERPRVELDITDVPKARVKVRLSCGMLQYTGGSGRDEWELGLGAAAERYMGKELERVFAACRDMGSDAMGFGRYASMKFASAREWEQYGWDERYPLMKASFEVELSLADEDIFSGSE